MNLNNLYYFKVMSQFQHYTKAAEYLCITQPSLSHAMAALEAEYGVPLFEKDGRNVKLSKYGQMLSTYINKGFYEIESGNNLLSQFSRKDSGIVDFSFLFVLGYQFVPMLIKSFYEEEKYSKITLQFNQLDTRTCIQRIKDGTIDVGLWTYMPNEPTIDFRSVLTQRLICITSVDHPLAEREVVSMEELLPYPIIRYKDNTGEIQTLIDQLFHSCNSMPETLCTMAEEVTMAGLISSGHRNCIAVVPDLEILQNYNIRKLELRHPSAYRKIYLAVSNTRPLPGCVKTFYDFALEYALKQGR